MARFSLCPLQDGFVGRKIWRCLPLLGGSTKIPSRVSSPGSRGVAAVHDDNNVECLLVAGLQPHGKLPGSDGWLLTRLGRRQESRCLSRVVRRRTVDRVQRRRMSSKIKKKP